MSDFHRWLYSVLVSLSLQLIIQYELSTIFDEGAKVYKLRERKCIPGADRGFGLGFTA
jgi:hypothetical protein